MRDPVDVERDRFLVRLAKRGFVNCTASQFRASFHSTDHRCDKFRPASDEVTAARRKWAIEAKRHAASAAVASPPPSRASEDEGTPS